MAIDTRFGLVEKMEDFLVTAIGDLPEIDVQSVTGVTNAIVAGGADGRFRLEIAATDDDDVGAVTFGAVNWTAGVDLYMQARIFLSSITDNKYFVGFADQIATGDDVIFDAAADAVTLGTDPVDAFGILFDNDATTKNFWCCAAKTNVVTLNKVLGARFNPAIDTALTLGCHVSADRKAMEFYINGETVHRVDSTTTLIAAVDLCPGVWAYEQGTAFNLDVDLIYGCKPRSTA